MIIMAVISARLIKDWNGVKAGQKVQLLEATYQSLKSNGFFADPDPELEELKKKLNPSQSVSDVSEEE